MEPKLTSPTTVRAILDELQIRPRKRLGQHFLIDYHVRERIVAALELVREDRVLEVGPGLGAITERLVALCDDVWAVEIDRVLGARLREQFGSSLHLQVGDALESDISSLVGGGRGKIVGNLPYYISTALVTRILEAGPSMAVVMLQAEVAERLAAPPGSAQRGAISLLREYWADIETVTRVRPQNFLPPPSVGSTVVRLRARPSGVEQPWEKIRAVVAVAFRFRRKTMETAMVEGFGIERILARTSLASSGIDARRRGETLSLSEFDRLAGELQAVGYAL